MRLGELKTTLKTSIFSRIDILKLFPSEPESQINTQLHRFIARGELVSIKRELYIFPHMKIDEFVIANKIYSPSYVSLESALNIYEIIPDITASVTSVATTTSRNFKTPLGSYLYSKITKELFFGYENILDKQSGLYYNIATPEKALLDYIYIRKIKNLSEYRVDISSLDMKELINFSSHFPKWVRKVLTNE